MDYFPNRSQAALTHPNNHTDSFGQDSSMEYKTLGDTGLLVSTLCFGCMTFHGGSGIWSKIGQVDQAGADALVTGCIDAGVNFFDTADVYSDGESETTLGTC